MDPEDESDRPFSILFGSNALKGVIESIIFSNSKIHKIQYRKNGRINS